MNIEQQIAKDLRDSGLFDWIAYHLCKPPYLQRAKVKPFHVGAIKKWAQQNKNFIDYGPWPDADTMWSIISEMGWQVVWMDTEDEWQLGCFEDDFFNDDVFAIWVNTRCPIYAAKGQLTLANNEAMAWISKKPEWRPKLEKAIKSIRGNHDK